MASVWSTILDDLRVAASGAIPGVEPSAIVFATPPNPALGDVAIPCFALAKTLQQKPPEIAARIADQLTGHPLVATATVAGPYVNIVLDPAELANFVLAAVAEQGDDYGNAECLPERREGVYPLPQEGVKPAPTSEGDRAQSIVLEFVSPNANKPLHLGHLRNAFIGEAIARLLEARGATVHRVCLVNDRGVHIMKSMLAYATWGQGSTPESEGIKGDHFVGNWYVVFAQKSAAERKALALPHDQQTPLEQEAAEWLRRWEASDPEIRALWTRMTDWVLEGFRASYATIGVSFEREYRESDIYEEGRRIVADALGRGVFVKDAKGNTVAPLKERFGVEDKVVERADGTTVYATQDLALAAVKARDLKSDRSIIITGNEQDYYFKQLNAVLELLSDADGIPRVARNDTTGGSATLIEHRSYGMVMLPEGRMKSREGTVVDADDLIAELTRLAEEEMRSRADAVPGEPAAGTTEPEVLVSDAALSRAKDIALAAVRFYLLLVTPETTVTFDPKASLAFTGKTGPYVQYMHARMCSIQRRAGDVAVTSRSPRAGGGPKASAIPNIAALLTEPAERGLLLRIAQFPDGVTAAADALDPSEVAAYAYDLARAFADFYRDVPVNKAEGDLRVARHALLEATRVTLARALTILGIAPLEEM